MYKPRYDTPPYRFNSFDPDFYMKNGGRVIEDYNDFDPELFVNSNGSIISDNFLGLGKGARKKKEEKHAFKLQKMQARTERRDLSNKARTRVGEKKADNKALKIQAEHEQEMARIDKQTPMGTDIPVTPISQTPMTNTGSSGGDYSEDYSQYVDSETQGNTGIESKSPETTGDPINPGGTGKILPEAIVKAKYPKKTNTTLIVVLLIVAVVAIVYFAPKLFKKK